MFPHHRHVDGHTTAKLCVTVTDLLGVQRVLMMLTGRQYQVTRFGAEEAGAGRWRLSIDCLATCQQVDMLRLRLNRLPSVLAVEVGSAQPSASGRMGGHSHAGRSADARLTLQH